MLYYVKIILIYVLLFHLQIIVEGNSQEPKAKTIVLTPKIYSSMFARNREQQKLFVKHLLKGDYEKNYKMINLAFEKIFEIIKENNATLNHAEYIPKNGFPEDERLQGAVSLILENTCLTAEIILHLPDISYRVLKRYDGWREDILWAVDFVNEFPHIVDENTFEMIGLFRQEVNIAERTEDFVNPYSQKIKQEKEALTKKAKKPKRKRLKRGPQLSKTEL